MQTSLSYDDGMFIINTSIMAVEPRLANTLENYEKEFHDRAVESCREIIGLVTWIKTPFPDTSSDMMFTYDDVLHTVIIRHRPNKQADPGKNGTNPLLNRALNGLYRRTALPPMIRLAPTFTRASTVQNPFAKLAAKLMDRLNQALNRKVDELIKRHRRLYP